LCVAKGKRDDLPDPALKGIALVLALRPVYPYVEIRVLEVDADHPVARKNDGAENRNTCHLKW
jgi:hypothetical protein